MELVHWVVLPVEGIVRRTPVALAARKRVLERSNAEDLAVVACSVRYKVGSPQQVGLVEVLEGDLVMGSWQVAFGHHKETVADAAEVADKMIGGDA